MALPKSSSFTLSESPPGFLSGQDTKKLDEVVHEQLARATAGLSPMSLALACIDWAMHLAVSPGKQLQLASIDCLLMNAGTWHMSRAFVERQTNHAS